jgi:phage shock protein PspC (stress-responsive transcriptional regulator)
MKKIININLSSRLIPIEDSAYELLKNYLDDLKRHFSKEEGGDEIVSDIEDRIAELFQDKLRKGAHCITDADITGVIATMGRPEQLEEETPGEPQHKNVPPAGDAAPPPHQRKKLLRDENDKIWGGVCSGLAAYLGVDPLIIRILTVLLVVAWGFGLVVYIVLWLALPSSQSLKNSTHKRLYRNPDKKVIGGVAAGIAAYMDIDPVIPRIVFVSPLLGIIFTSIFHHWISFHGFFFPLSLGSLPTLTVLYIVLWISVPKARTVTEKLEMRGEKVDIQSIANAMKGSAPEEKKNELTNEPAAVTGFSSTQGSETPAPQESPVAGGRSRRSGFAAFILLLLKIFAYFVGGIILIAICIALVALAGGFIGAAGTTSLMLPYKELLLHGTLQKILAWPAILLTVGIPVVAILWLILKVITGFRPKTRAVGISLFLLWIVGVICCVWLCISLLKDFRMRYRESSPFTIEQPRTGGILITETPSNVSIGGWDVFDSFIETGDDTVILKSVSLNVIKSPNDSFRLDVMRSSNGRSIHEARDFAREINFSVTQVDSVVYIPDGFALPREIPFRKQRVILNMYVPVGKKIRIDESLRNLRGLRRWSFDDQWDTERDGTPERWDYDQLYLMTPDGLQTVAGEKTDTANDVPGPETKPRHDENRDTGKPGKSPMQHPASTPDSVSQQPYHYKA